MLPCAEEGHLDGVLADTVTRRVKVTIYNVFLFGGVSVTTARLLVLFRDLYSAFLLDSDQVSKLERCAEGLRERCT